MPCYFIKTFNLQQMLRKPPKNPNNKTEAESSKYYN